jgi:hypothetical protein
MGDTKGYQQMNEKIDSKVEEQSSPNGVNALVRLGNFLFAGKAAAWTAVFTAVLTILTYKISATYVLINNTSQTSERAFLTFLGPQNGARLVGSTADLAWKAQEVALLWTNAGNTPARDVIIQANANAFFPDLPYSYDFPLGEKTRIVLGPKGNYGTNVQISKEVIADAIHGKKRLFVWGTAIYKDEFANTPERLSEFCVELTHLTIDRLTTPQEKGPSQQPKAGSGPISFVDIDEPKAALIGFQWQQCHSHNCYDKDCSDYEERVNDMRK